VELESSLPLVSRNAALLLDALMLEEGTQEIDCESDDRPSWVGVAHEACSPCWTTRPHIRAQGLLTPAGARAATPIPETRWMHRPREGGPVSANISQAVRELYALPTAWGHGI
jgi:hypothetical protein